MRFFVLEVVSALTALALIGCESERTSPIEPCEDMAVSENGLITQGTCNGCDPRCWLTRVQPNQLWDIVTTGADQNGDNVGFGVAPGTSTSFYSLPYDFNQWNADAAALLNRTVTYGFSELPMVAVMSECADTIFDTDAATTPGGPYAGELNSMLAALYFAGFPPENVIIVSDAAEAMVYSGTFDVLLIPELENCHADAVSWFPVVSDLINNGGRVVTAYGFINVAFINNIGLFGHGTYRWIGAPFTTEVDPFWTGLVHPGYLSRTYGWMWYGAGVRRLAYDPPYLERMTVFAYESGPTGLVLRAGDADGDNLPDATDPSPTDANGDVDGDGVPDAYEITVLGTDPYVADVAVGPKEFYVVSPFGGGPVYVDLPPITITLDATDIYFLVNSSLSMTEEVAALQADLSTTIIPAAQALFGDVQFGVGEYRDYAGDLVPYRNLSNITSDTVAVQAAMDSIVTADGGAGYAESAVQAINAVATGDDIGCYTTPAVCPVDYVGYPCFRPNSQPIVMLFTDHEFHNGMWDNYDSAMPTGVGYECYDYNEPSPCININGECAVDPLITCTSDVDCPTAPSPCINMSGECELDPLIICASDVDCPTTTTPCSGGVCDVDPLITCTTDVDCPTTTSLCINMSGECTVDPLITCTSDVDCPNVPTSCTGIAGECQIDPLITCTSDWNCPNACELASECIPLNPSQPSIWSANWRLNNIGGRILGMWSGWPNETGRYTTWTWGLTWPNIDDVTDIYYSATNTHSYDRSSNRFVYGVSSDGVGLETEVVNALTDFDTEHWTYVSETSTDLDSADPNAGPLVVFQGTACSDCWWHSTSSSGVTGARSGSTVTYRAKIENGRMDWWTNWWQYAVHPTDVAQQFDVVGRVYHNNAHLQDEFTFHIMVPGTDIAVPQPTSGSYWHVYDALDTCTPTETPRWARLFFNVTIPDDTALTLIAQTSATNDFSLSPIVPLTYFPGEASLNLRSELEDAGELTSNRYLKITADMSSTASGLSPVIHYFILENYCL